MSAISEKHCRCCGAPWLNIDQEDALNWVTAMPGIDAQRLASAQNWTKARAQKHLRGLCDLQIVTRRFERQEQGGPIYKYFPDPTAPKYGK